MATSNASGRSPAAVAQYSSATFDKQEAPGFAVFALGDGAELQPGSQLVFVGLFAGKTRQHDVAHIARARLEELGWSADDAACSAARPCAARRRPHHARRSGPRGRCRSRRPSGAKPAAKAKRSARLGRRREGRRRDRAPQLRTMKAAARCGTRDARCPAATPADTTRRLGSAWTKDGRPQGRPAGGRISHASAGRGRAARPARRRAAQGRGRLLRPGGDADGRRGRPTSGSGEGARRRRARADVRDYRGDRPAAPAPAIRRAWPWTSSSRTTSSCGRKRSSTPACRLATSSSA